MILTLVALLRRYVSKLEDKKFRQNLVYVYAPIGLVLLLGFGLCAWRSYKTVKKTWSHRRIRSSDSSELCSPLMPSVLTLPCSPEVGGGAAMDHKTDKDTLPPSYEKVLKKEEDPPTYYQSLG